MKKQLLFLLALGCLSLVSVSCGASPPSSEYCAHESIIKPGVNIVAPVTTTEFVAVVAVESAELFYCFTEVKRQSFVQTVCLVPAPISEVENRAALSWCRETIFPSTTMEINFQYTEGRATEYRCC